MGWVNLIFCLLPDPAVVRLETWGTEHAPLTITLTLISRSRPASCPLCCRRARLTHSWYERALADLPWGEHAVAVQLRVRELFCDNAGCKRCVFTERLPGVAVPWPRKTARLSERLTAVGLALGSTAGARLSGSMCWPRAGSGYVSHGRAADALTRKLLPLDGSRSAAESPINQRPAPVLPRDAGGSGATAGGTTVFTPSGTA